MPHLRAGAIGVPDVHYNAEALSADAEALSCRGGSICSRVWLELSIAVSLSVTAGGSNADSVAAGCEASAPFLALSTSVMFADAANVIQWFAS